MQRIKRLEAGDSSQARGMDTQAMLPVLAMVAELIAMLGFRWVSVPDLRYSPYAQAGMLWKLEETAKGIAWNYQVPGGDDPGGRPGRRVSADRDGGECDPWSVLHPAGVPGQGESETAGAIRIFMEHGDDGGCPVVGDRYQYGTEPFGGA